MVSPADNVELSSTALVDAPNNLVALPGRPVPGTLVPLTRIDQQPRDSSGERNRPPLLSNDYRDEDRQGRGMESLSCTTNSPAPRRYKRRPSFHRVLDGRFSKSRCHRLSPDRRSQSPSRTYHSRGGAGDKRRVSPDLRRSRSHSPPCTYHGCSSARDGRGAPSDPKRSRSHRRPLHHSPYARGGLSDRTQHDKTSVGGSNGSQASVADRNRGRSREPPRPLTPEWTMQGGYASLTTATISGEGLTREVHAHLPSSLAYPVEQLPVLPHTADVALPPAQMACRSVGHDEDRTGSYSGGEPTACHS